MPSQRANTLLRASGILVLSALVSTLANASPARAGFSEFFLLHEVDYTQTSNSQPVAESRASLLAEATSTTSPDFATVKLTPPIGSLQSLTESPSGSGLWNTSFSSNVFATKSLLDAAFPTGAYTITGTGGSAPTTSTINDTQSAYPLSVPFLSGTSYSSLQGLNPSNPITVTWDSFQTGSIANSPYVFFTIIGPSGDVYNQILASTATSVSFSANTFSSNTAYSFQLGFVNDILSTDPSGVFQDNRFAYLTSGTFLSGPSSVPEPSTIVMSLSACVIGLGASHVRCRRRGAV
jgi:hypothetical protein